MKYCYKCGKQLKNTDEFCKACGVEQDDVIQKNEMNDNKNLKLTIINEEQEIMRIGRLYLYKKNRSLSFLLF